MKSFNLSDWALRHRSLVWYFMIVFSVAGLFAYLGLGREEDPSFTIKTMTISAQWPGASVEETTRQVTDRIERKLEELEQLDYSRSMTTPGQTLIFVNLKPTTKARDVPNTWLNVRNMIRDIQAQFPAGVVGPFFNDKFGDVYGNIYAFTSDGVSQRQLRDHIEEMRRHLLSVPSIGKIDIVGAQNEVIYLEFSPRKTAALGIDRQSVMATLRAQNAIEPSGVVQSGDERIAIRVGGQFSSEESLRAINFQVGGRYFRLDDIATITRGYQDPPSALFRYNGQPAIALAIGMKAGGNLLAFGEALRKQLDVLLGNLPHGITMHLVADQPKMVDAAISGFTRALFEAVAIVLVVSFISLGMRAGFVVALSIPLVLAITFVVMQYTGISLQRISLGALIIALGLLVDDAMIAIEMMVARLEQGDPLEKAATAVYTYTAWPMLTGTLVTVAGFIPIGLNSSAAGEFTFTLFVVLAVSLLVSWVVAVLFAPLLGVALLPRTMQAHHEKKSWFMRTFEALLDRAMRWRWLTLGLTIATFALSVFGMRFVQEQFFPNSDRPEIIVDWSLPQNASITQTRDQIARFEKEMLEGNPDIALFSSYVGQGAVRFVLSYDVQPGDPAFGQTVIVTKSLKARDRLKPVLQDYLKKTFPGTDAFVKLLDIGPPVGRPVQYRISGPDIGKVREYAVQFAQQISKNPHLGDIAYDWNEPARVIRVDVLQDKARLLGVSSQSIASALNGIVGGTVVTQLRDDIYLINVIARATADQRQSVEGLQNLQLPGTGGAAVPLEAVARFRYELEQPVVWRRARLPTVSVKAGLIDASQPATVVKQLQGTVSEFSKALPAGYAVAVGGSVEASAESQEPIAAVVPMMLFVMATILMIQLQSFARLFLVAAVAPLALIGVVAALLPTGVPLGFVAILGVLALIGILIRNSVILVVQIEELRADGMDAWQAVREATIHRMRPIMLTAAAASLALIPIAQDVFWGPMAYAMMGGIIVGTVLTLIFLPALYVAWFRIAAPGNEDSKTPAALAQT